MTGAAALALAAGVVVYAVADGDRLPEVVLGVGAAGWALAAAAVGMRRAALLPPGLALVAGTYGLFLSLRGGSVDAAAPAVAAALFLAAELGFASCQRTVARAERTVVLRRLAAVVGAAVAAALVASLLLVVATGVAGSLALEAAGVGAAVATLAAIALLASRPSV
jgi:hypothetical protein